MGAKGEHEWKHQYTFTLIVLAAVAVFGALFLEEYVFNPISVDFIAGILIPIFVIAVFLERAQEVFVTVWRDIDRTTLERKVKRLTEEMKGNKKEGEVAKASEELETAKLDLDQYKASTKRWAFLFSLSLGILISIVGVRALRPLTSMDADPTGFQRFLFNFADIVLTGALIGGGSEGIHRVMSVITDFLGMTRKLIAQRSKPAVDQE